ncbi:class I SAM-dependent methyltransferase [Streptosporangium sp. NBC_01756]|uniref:class I SAM-dependent methyltransferase n=1 Tax=Streptosporangium sp. NBC_01756 TaxID=2975950 RepID=UPI002DD978FE|nr:methyltransferase domain-containing protein [Streptosporangium sp. NBC_01756]WSC85389.1 methyltransferase domain-containing protein [Streptosporangium sp. NBC_01756]
MSETANIGEHYDKRSPIGDELRNGQLHMWYWYDREDDASLTEAVHRMTRKVTDTLGLRAGEHVLDAGCGPGETAVYLATRFGVRVTGITVSRFEIDRAVQRAIAGGVGDAVTFEYDDFMSLSYPDATFDAVLALESLQNAPDLDQVLAELYRVLRPGGRISFSDFSLTAKGDMTRVATFMDTLKLPRLPMLPQWLEYARAAGFEIEEYTECGPRVFGQKAKYLETALRMRDEVTAKFGADAVDEFSRLHHGFFTPRKDQIGYVIVSARKPHR